MYQRSALYYNIKIIKNKHFFFVKNKNKFIFAFYLVASSVVDSVVDVVVVVAAEVVVELVVVVVLVVAKIK